MNRWKRLGAVAVGLPIAVLFPSAPAGASTSVAAYSSHSGSMGTIVGASVASAVSTPDDGQFVQMDLGSEIVLAFPSGVNAEPDGTSAADLEIDVYDEIYPACATISGSSDGISFASLDAGAATHPGCPSGSGLADTADILIDLDAAGAEGVHFVKVAQAEYIDPAFPGLGFDLDGVVAHNTEAPLVVDGDDDDDTPWLGGAGECPEGTEFAWKLEGLGKYLDAEDEEVDVPLHTDDGETFVGIWAPGPSDPDDAPTLTVTSSQPEGEHQHSLSDTSHEFEEILSFTWTSPTFEVISVYSKAGNSGSTSVAYPDGAYEGEETVTQGLSHVTFCFGGGGGVDEVTDADLTVDKFYDADADGVWDDGETALAWSFGVSSVETPEVGDDIVTWLFDATTSHTETLPLGSYVVEEHAAVETNWRNTTDTSVDVDLDADTTVEFGNVCLGAGGGHTLGYWSNKNGQSLIAGDDLAMLTALNLRNADGTDADFDDKSVFRSWLLRASATNMAHMLSAQLAAMELNVLNGKVSGDSLVYAPGSTAANAFGFVTVDDLMDEANDSLGTNGLTVSASAERTYQQALKDALDDANNNSNFVQAEACAYSFPDPEEVTV